MNHPENLKTILVVDDDLNALREISTLLSKERYRVYTFTSVSEALEWLEFQRPELIISDVMMQPTDGYQFCLQVRKRVEWELIPFIFLSADRRKMVDVVKGLQSGADYYVKKPFSQMEFKAIITRALEREETEFRHSNFDQLTNIFNRRFFDRLFVEEVRRSVRYGVPLSVAIFDIDHFKNFNDQHGHQAGDFILKNLAQFVQKKLRDLDTVCRYGGEEFAVLLPETQAGGALVVMDRLRKEIGNTVYSYRLGSVDLMVTVSIGISECPKNGKTPEEIIKCADEAMYYSKNSGRNQSSIYKTSP